MVRKLLRQPLTFGHAAVVLLAAAVVGGGAFAVASIPGPDGRIKGCVKKSGAREGAVRVVGHTSTCSRRERTLRWSQRGPRGLSGERGQPGENGDDGPPGSPDTPAQVLDKLKTVDGSGSGLNADQLDGEDEAAFLRSDRVKFGFRVVHNDATQDNILSTGAIRLTDDGAVDADHTVLVHKQTTFGGNVIVVSPSAQQSIDDTPAVVTTASNTLDFYVRDQFDGDHYIRCGFIVVTTVESVVCSDVNGSTGF